MADFWNLQKAQDANLEEDDLNYKEWGQHRMADEKMQKEQMPIYWMSTPMKDYRLFLKDDPDFKGWGVE